MASRRESKRSSRIFLYQYLLGLSIFLESLIQFSSTIPASSYSSLLLGKEKREGELESDWQTKSIGFLQDSNSSFSACLLVMDDNHYLIEWLAYHYHKLPLRYLVIAVDPRSRTSPSFVLDRWDKYMTIIRWTDSDFLPKEWLNRRISETDSKSKFIMHRERQRNFYPACFRHLKRAKRAWTIVIDVDEFAIAQNTHYINATPKASQATMLQAIKGCPRKRCEKRSCITMPRLRFGNFEENNVSNKSNWSPHGFSDKYFLTLRWRWRSGLHNRKNNRNPKSMIDVSNIDESSFLRNNTDAHRPVRSVCPRRELYLLNRNSEFSVHHYIGTREQWDFRKDAREGMKQRNSLRFEEYHHIHDELDESVCGWLQDFCRLHGLSKSKRLLEGVGNVSFGDHFV